ncbi:GPI-anchored protein [Phytophthora cinnamomi]|uniref:GPI-anchored protein n=2 Tax=Phytophthora cinnamomi TaxID=4785 RepID=UPI00355A794E|nr:GPI-anchored protein [Phytophthora cinnamomi]
MRLYQALMATTVALFAVCSTGIDAAGTPATATTTAKSASGFCAKPRVRITEVNVGAAVDANEDEVALKVVAISPLPSGGSRIAFHSGGNVIVRELDANDKLVTTSPAVKVPFHDFGDIHADKNGFVIVGTKPAQGGGTLNCGNPSNLCGSAPNPPVPCYDMYMARFDGAAQKWATKLTSSSASLPPYSSGKKGPNVYMIWWYAHHGRIAFDGTNWAAYFGAAISTSEGGCINIHQGDRMKVVDPSGKITNNKDSFDWGCSHSGYERITYDNRTHSFASICKTDSNNRLMPPNNWDATIYPVDLAASNLGDIVPDSIATSNKYWSVVSNGNGDNAKVHLIHYDLKSKASQDIVLGGTSRNERAPHLAPMGKGGMLAMWEGSSSGGDLQEGSDRTIFAQVLDRATGKALSQKITVDKSVVGNRYQALKSYPDGSVAYLSKGKTGTSVQVVRFFGC